MPYYLHCAFQNHDHNHIDTHLAFMVAARNARCKPGSGAAHPLVLLNQADSKKSENLEACFYAGSYIYEVL